MEIGYLERGALQLFWEPWGRRAALPPAPAHWRILSPYAFAPCVPMSIVDVDFDLASGLIWNLELLLYDPQIRRGDLSPPFGLAPGIPVVDVAAYRRLPAVPRHHVPLVDATADVAFVFDGDALDLAWGDATDADGIEGIVSGDVTFRLADSGIIGLRLAGMGPILKKYWQRTGETP